MLQLFRRHTKACIAGREQHDREFKRCNCVLHVDGTLAGHRIRESTHFRDEAEANRLVREAEACGKWNHAKPTQAKSVVDATALFLADAASNKGRALAKPTLGKYRTLLGRLNAFCERCAIASLADLTPDAVRAFRDTWPTGPAASGNNIARLKAFLKFAVENEWLSRNPAAALRTPKYLKRNDKQKLPFAQREMKAIISSAESVSLGLGSSDLITLIHLMHQSGLRISDAALLRVDRLHGEQLALYTQKTGSWVEMPLPGWLLLRLRKIEPKDDGYLFVAEGASKRLETVTDLWRRKIARVFKAAGIVGGHPHRFRHTFAVDLLVKGVDPKTVSLLLGHSSVTVTEKFYSAWIGRRQAVMSETLRRTWNEESVA